MLMQECLSFVIFWYTDFKKECKKYLARNALSLKQTTRDSWKFKNLWFAKIGM